MLKFTKATKTQARLRLAVFGPSGAGKTYTALRLATGLGGRVALIDTERGSASKYADRFEFDTLELPSRDINTYCEGIRAASGYQVLIIDSLTHGWHELLDEVERIARSKYSGNTWSAWSEGTPKQRQLVNALLGFEGHVIATMRSKTEWTIEKDEKGRNKPTRVGLAPEQGKGIEYEFDLLIEMSVNHLGHVIKDRTGKYQDQIIDKPGEDFGRDLAAWLSDGETIEEHAPSRDDTPPADTPVVVKKNGVPQANDRLDAIWKSNLKWFHAQLAERGLEHDEAKKLLGVEHFVECGTPQEALDRLEAVR